MKMRERVSVKSDTPCTIEWWEFLLAWCEYTDEFGPGIGPEDLLQATGGLTLEQLTRYLGSRPETLVCH